MTDPANRRFKAGVFVGGLILVALGVVFLLEELELADFGAFVRLYWPLIIVAVGLTKLFNRETVGSGIGMVAVGLWLQTIQLGLFGLTFRNSWPLLLIAIGAGMIVQVLVDSASRKADHEV